MIRHDRPAPTPGAHDSTSAGAAPRASAEDGSRERPRRAEPPAPLPAQRDDRPGEVAVECAHARRLPHVRATEPERFLEGVRVVLFGRNRADRLRRALDALAGASRRGAEIVYVDGGSRDRSADVARRHPAGARAAADLASAAFGGSEPRFVACASLRCDVDWRCLDAMARNAARSSGGALHAARLVGPDGATIEDGPVALAGEAAQDRALPAVWLARAGDARAALEGRFEGPIRRRVDATALLVEPAAAERR